jgi:AraC-like DNA-binding protein
MHRKIRRNLTIGVLVLAGAAFAGGAYAATQSGTDSRQAFLNDVANRLHVTPAQLQDALRGATLDQLQAAVKAGRLTQAQANAIAQGLAQGRGPEFFRFGLPFRGPHLLAFGGGLDAAATYLGLTRQQLFERLSSGKSLAQIAMDRGKSVSGLEQAMIAALKSRLDQAVKDGRITVAQEQRILADLSARIADQVNRAGLMCPGLPGPGARSGLTPPPIPLPSPSGVPVPVGPPPQA